MNRLFVVGTKEIVEIHNCPDVYNFIYMQYLIVSSYITIYILIPG